MGVGGLFGGDNPDVRVGSRRHVHDGRHLRWHSDPVAAERAPLVAESRIHLGRAGAWLSDAMDAWSDEATDKVAALAPLAVELAAKAMLWQVNPTLLVPLDRQYEASLVQLATDPRLSGENVRTVGLAEALRPAVSVASNEPAAPWGGTLRERAERRRKRRQAGL